MPAVGTLAWSRNGRMGQLTTFERVRLLGRGTPALARLPHEIWVRLRSSHRDRPIDAPMQPPTSDAARIVDEHCRAVYEDWLYAHCRRTFDYAAMFAASRSYDFDSDLLWVASLTHDLGLTERYESQPTNDHCFAMRGAAVAAQLVDGHWAPERAARLRDAVILHVNPYVWRSQGTEAHLLNYATALDVAGTRYRTIHSAEMQSTLERWTRGEEFGSAIWAAWKTEADAHDQCRGAFLNRLFLRRLVCTSPFGDTREVCNSD